MPIEKDELDRLVEGGRPSPFPPFCVACGYNMTGSVSERCSECGYPFNAREWRRKEAELEHRVEQIRQANAWAGHGVKIALAGMLLALIALASGNSPMAKPLVPAALIGGVAALFLGLSVFRVGRLPVWARELVATPPNYTLAAVSSGLGVVLVLLVIGFL